MAIEALEQNNEEIYIAGYEDGVHDGYYSSSIEDGTEEKHFGKSYKEQPTCKDCKHWKDSDGLYCRGIGAESKCPINNSRVFEGTFYCADFEKRGDLDGSN